MARFLFALRFAVGFIYLGVVSAFFVTLLVLLIPFRVARIKVCNVYGSVLGGGITTIGGITMTVQHKERLEGSMPCVFVMNHASTLDLFTGIWLCPTGNAGVMKRQVIYIPFFGQIAWLSGHVLLDRDNRQKAVEQLGDSARFLKQHGLGLWIFPEGTRSKDGRLQPFKKGFVHFAIATGMKVVPVVMHGAQKAWPAGSFDVRPVPIEVEVLEPIDTSTWREETSAEHAQLVHDVFAARLKEDQKPLPKLS